MCKVMGQQIKEEGGGGRKVERGGTGRWEEGEVEERGVFVVLAHIHACF